jgi:transposase
MEPGNSVSLVARKYNVAPKSALPMEAFYGKWCKPRNRERRESNSRIRSLERLLGRKTEENEILKEAVVLARKKKLISQKPLEGIEGFQ